VYNIQDQFGKLILIADISVGENIQYISSYNVWVLPWGRPFAAKTNQLGQFSDTLKARSIGDWPSNANAVYEQEIGAGGYSVRKNRITFAISSITIQIL